MANEIHLSESETTIRFGMRIVAYDKTRGAYLGDPAPTSSVTSARKFPSVDAAKTFCSDNGVENYRIVAYLPGAVAGNCVVLAETGAVTAAEPPGKARFD